jgi:hypothetical protein
VKVIVYEGKRLRQGLPGRYGKGGTGKADTQLVELENERKTVALSHCGQLMVHPVALSPECQHHNRGHGKAQRAGHLTKRKGRPRWRR